MLYVCSFRVHGESCVACRLVLSLYIYATISLQDGYCSTNCVSGICCEDHIKWIHSRCSSGYGLSSFGVDNSRRTRHKVTYDNTTRYVFGGIFVLNWKLRIMSPIKPRLIYRLGNDVVKPIAKAQLFWLTGGVQYCVYWVL